MKNAEISKSIFMNEYFVSFTFKVNFFCVLKVLRSLQIGRIFFFVSVAVIQSLLPTAEKIHTQV